jgi:hypothetical protein
VNNDLRKRIYMKFASHLHLLLFPWNAAEVCARTLQLHIGQMGCAPESGSRQTRFLEWVAF